MNELTIITKNNNHYIDSREVAEIVGKDHKNLLRDIRNYINIMEKSNELKIEPVHFFIESTYKDNKGETRVCYLLTKMGCESVAHKMTGEKGILFTAAYVKRFNEMETREHMTSVPKPAQLSDYNAAARTIVGTLKDANVPADRIAVTVKRLYELSGIPISLDGMITKRGYTACEIARYCGMLSLNENPHFLAMTAIISSLDVGDEHKTYIPYFYGRNIRISVQYDEYVINEVRRWLVRYDYPCEIYIGGKTYSVMYEDDI